MKLLELITAPWAIVPEKLLEMQAIYATHLRGDKIDLDAVEARLGRPLANDQQEYSLRDGGVAVLPIDGVLAPKANIFTRISGGASTQMLTMQLESAIADARVKSIVLQIDSPGGSVFGAPEFAATVRELAQVKPIVAVSDGMMASAAYWIGSAANARFVSGPTVHVGSIGVVATHNYAPGNQGTKTTEITAGKYKRIASSNAPLSEEGRAYIQDQVDHLYSAFIDAVAGNLNLDPSVVLERMADGRIFIGQQAIDNGLVDGFATVDAVVEQLAADPQRYVQRKKVQMKPKAAAVPAALGDPLSEQAGAAAEDVPPFVPRTSLNFKDITMPPEADKTPITREILERDHPQLFAQMRAEFTAAGAAGEIARVKAVREASLPGHEKLVEQLAADGKTTGAEAAAQVLAAERGVRQTQASAHANDAPPAAPGSAAPAGEQKKPEADMSLPVEERCKAAWEADPKIRAEFGTLAGYTALVKAEESGRVKVLGKRAA